MIPKKIHYFWFSNDPFPENIQRCMDSWKKVMPDYEIIKWDLTNTPMECDFAQKAMREQQWAFLSDYARLRILYEQGGIYLDTDMLAIKPLGDLLNEQAFWGRANNGMVEPVVIGAVKNHPTIKACLDVYLNKKTESTYKEIPLEIRPVFTALGLDEDNHSTQHVGANTIYSYDYFCPMPFEQADSLDPLAFKTKNTYAVHLWNAAWFDPFRFFWNGRPKKGWQAVWQTVRKNPFQGCAFYRSVLFHLRRCLWFKFSKQKNSYL
jgi:hypothetical protein